MVAVRRAPPGCIAGEAGTSSQSAARHRGHHHRPGDRQERRVDEQYEEIVIDSEGSKLRFGFNAIAREYIRPAYVSDDEVDENGNPLPDEDTEAPANDEAGQVPIEASVVSEEDTADETGDDNETKTKCKRSIR